MMILQIDSSISGEASVSRRLTRDIVTRLVAGNPETRVIYRDLVEAPPPFLSRHLMALRLDPSSSGRLPQDALSAARQASSLLQEFLDADTVVLGVPMYNFGIAAQLKAWFDHLLIAGRTFQYTREGPPGLMGGKKVVIASSRGGKYQSDGALGSDHQETHLLTLLHFIGIADIAVVRAEGLALGQDHRERALDQAALAIGNL